MTGPIATILRYLSSLALTLSVFPANDPVRDTLQGKANHFSSCVTAATVLVAVGVALEAVELVHVAANWLKRLNRRKRERIELAELGDIFPSSDARGEKESNQEPKWIKVALRFGLILVVTGVVGEWRYGAKLEDAHNAIHAYDLEKLRAADEKAGEAATSAKTAHDEADAVKGVADEARADAKDALLKAQAAQRSLAQAESDAAKAQVVASNALRRSTEAESHIEGAVRQADEVSKKVDAAKKDVAVLQSLMSARRILDVKSFEQLRPLKGKTIFTLSTQDDEPKTLCVAIRSALQLTSEMNVGAGCGSMEFVGPGIFVTGPDLAESKLVAKALSDAIGVDVTPVPDGPASPNRTGNPNLLKVFVGPKGLFWFGK